MNPERDLVRDVAAASAGSVVASLPVFLVAALAVQLQEDLGFGESGQGVAVALYFVSAAVCSLPFGRMVASLGALRVMRTAAVCSGLLLLVVAAAVRSWATLLPAMMVAGASSAAMQPAANVFLARRIPAARQGFAFGFKQSAVPASTLLAGLAVPVVALTVGWRWAFVAAGALALVVAATLPRPRTTLAQRRAQPSAPPLPREQTVPLVVLSAGFLLGIAGATALASFLATASVHAGVSKGTAGLLVALGGVSAMLARIVTGVLADRRGGRHLPVVAAMLLTGSAGYVLLAVAAAARLPVLLVPGVVLAFGAGWGWNGLFNFAVIRTHQDHPAQATAITQAGGRVGGVLGPLLFGFVVTHGSYAAAWSGAVVAAVLSAATMLVGRRMLVRQRAAGR